MPPTRKVGARSACGAASAALLVGALLVGALLVGALRGQPAAYAATPSATPSAPLPTDTAVPVPTPTLTPSPTPSPTPTPTPPPEPVNKTLLLGHSARGVAIYAYRRNAINSHRRVLVLGSIHGDEDQGKRVAYYLREHPGGFQRDVEVWLIPTINPDGNALHIRRNARGVDLNRNFPYGWVYDPDPVYNSGPSAASEPETRALITFLRTYHPRTELVFHQPLGCVDLTSSTREASSVISRNTGLPLRTLGWRHGSQAKFAQMYTKTSIALTVELTSRPSTTLINHAITGVRQLSNLR